MSKSVACTYCGERFSGKTVESARERRDQHLVAASGDEEVCPREKEAADLAAKQESGFGVGADGETPEDANEVVVKTSVIRSLVEKMIETKRRLDLPNVPLDELTELIGELEQAVDEEHEADQRRRYEEASGVESLLLAYLEHARLGKIDAIALAMADPEGGITYQFFAPAQENMLSSAVGQLDWSIKFARHADAMAQRQRAEKGGRR